MIQRLHPRARTAMILAIINGAIPALHGLRGILYAMSLPERSGHSAADWGNYYGFVSLLIALPMLPCSLPFFVFACGIWFRRGWAQVGLAVISILYGLGVLVAVFRASLPFEVAFLLFAYAGFLFFTATVAMNVRVVRDGGDTRRGFSVVR